MANIRFINPDTLTKPPTYTQVVEVTGPGRVVYISGQLATGLDGNLVSRDFRQQALQVFENLKAALAAVGASFNDVVKYAENHSVNNRIAAYMLAVDRVAYITRVRGIYA